MSKILHEPHDYCFLLLQLLFCINVVQRPLPIYIKDTQKTNIVIPSRLNDGHW